MISEKILLLITINNERRERLCIDGLTWPLASGRARAVGRFRFPQLIQYYLVYFSNVIFLVLWFGASSRTHTCMARRLDILSRFVGLGSIVGVRTLLMVKPFSQAL
jgi:hypothetical protein